MPQGEEGKVRARAWAWVLRKRLRPEEVEEGSRREEGVERGPRERQREEAEGLTCFGKVSICRVSNVDAWAEYSRRRNVRVKEGRQEERRERSKAG